MMGMRLASMKRRVVSRTRRSSWLSMESNSMKSTPLNLKTGIGFLLVLDDIPPGGDGRSHVGLSPPDQTLQRSRGRSEGSNGSEVVSHRHLATRAIGSDTFSSLSFRTFSIPEQV